LFKGYHSFEANSEVIHHLWLQLDICIVFLDCTLNLSKQMFYIAERFVELIFNLSINFIIVPFDKGLCILKFLYLREIDLVAQPLIMSDREFLPLKRVLCFSGAFI
jgi:hypothetical protein